MHCLIVLGWIGMQIAGKGYRLKRHKVQKGIEPLADDHRPTEKI
jgi:hypothetical protein